MPIEDPQQKVTQRSPAVRPPSPATAQAEPAGNGKLFTILAFMAAVVVVLFAVGLFPRLAERKDLREAHDETVGAKPIVHVIIAAPANQTESITLPGNIGAIQYTTIYARVNGYLKSRLVDIGDHVTTGQLLAVIDTPTVDQALEQAKAQLLEAQAGLMTSKADLKEADAKDDTAHADIDKSQGNVDYAKVTADRWIDLAERGAVSPQSRDEKVRYLTANTADLLASKANERAAAAAVKAAKAGVKQAEAKVKAKEADVLRLTAEQSFQKVYAPFEGVITERKVDPGALITQGSMSSNLELYQLAKIDNLRVYVSVPQRVARYLHPGMTADVLVPEYPERTFTGTVTNVSGALDPSTRTRQTEIKIPNPDHAMLPGMYAEIRMSTLRDAPWIRVPGTTLVTRNDGQYVVVIKDGKVHYQPITIGRDFGNEVEVRMGLEGKEEVVVSPNNDLREGEPVESQPFKAD